MLSAQLQRVLAQTITNINVSSAMVAFAGPSHVSKAQGTHGNFDDNEAVLSCAVDAG